MRYCFFKMQVKVLSECSVLSVLDTPQASIQGGTQQSGLKKSREELCLGSLGSRALYINEVWMKKQNYRGSIWNGSLESHE